MFEEFIQNLSDCRVCMYHHPQLIQSLARSHGVGSLVDEVCAVDPHDVHAQDFTGVLSVNHLGKTIWLLHGEGLRVALERNLRYADLVSIASLLGFIAGCFFVDTDKTYLRVREAGSRDVAMVHDILTALNVLNSANALGAGRMRKHVFTVGVTDGIDVFHNVTVFVRYLHLVVNGDETAAEEVDVQVLETEAFCVGPSAGGNHDSINF
mmetsp:Transcript_19051/g.35909  ORF Transcript_19051/g.35909 Transcript_19051/m.35909 type:complete len:209 (+) Transcript_19051:339-965(+)